MEIAISLTILCIILLTFTLWQRHERQKELLRRQENERRQERARQEEYDRVEKLTQAGTPEFLLSKVIRLEGNDPVPAHLCIKECTKIYGSSGKFELRLKRYWDKFKAAWLAWVEIRFIYPEMNINQKIYEEEYRIPMGLPLRRSTQIFTYTDDPDEVGSGLFYILDKYVEVDGELVKVRGSRSSGPDLYIRINNPFTQKGK